YEALFQPNLPQGQALRLAPNDRGGYDLSQIPFAWENDGGRDLHLDDGLQRGCSEPLSFPFLFFGQWQEEVYACNDGVISVGQITRYREYQYRYGGGAPLIMPLLMDLDPTISEGGIFVRQDAGRLVVTWDRLRGFRRPEAELTFQAVLYPDGVLEFAYQDLPGDIRFRPNDDPGAGPWAIGVVSGGLRGDGPQEIDLAPLPLQGGPAGMVHDYVRAFRQHLHRLLAPLAWLILLASALVVTGFPLLFYVSLVRPLNSLLAGVREVNAGNLELSMPIQAQDEIGFLTQAFNSMIAALRASINSLEDEVRRRTRQLEEQNAELAQARTLAEERRRIAEVERQTAEAANEAKSIFLANMSHELRTPLTAVLGYSELMAHDRNLTSEQRQNLARIGRSGEHLLALINNVLQLSRIEAGRLELEPEEMDLHLLLAGLEEMFYLRAQQKGLQLRSEIGAGVPRLVRADQGKLRQVLINLLGNAVKFTSEGQITLRVRHLAAISGDGAAGPGASRRLRFEVEDTGIGIKPEERNIIFEPFIQTARGRGAAPGTGLGLSISRQFVELMGGALTVHSAGIPGQGSLFAFDLPVDIVEAQDTLPARVRRRAVALEAGQPAYRLLVVDDVTASRVLLVKLLQPLGFEIREAANGQEALAAWEEWRPHLIWMDRRMPGMDGDEAMRRIKATAGGEETIVIALTASAFEEERAATLARGYDDFLRKPARSGEILDILAKHLGARFVYEKLPPEAPAAAEGTAETLNVADLPPEWRAALRKAVVEADVGRIAALAQESQDLAPAAALALDQALADFDYDLILGALERCGDNEQTIREEQG
ncbi:MAG: ATP-binding protein, partial [Anaerolineae bacterium]